MKSKTVEEMTTWFIHFIAEMGKMGIETLEKDKIDTIKSILPSSYSTFLMVLKENNYFANEDLMSHPHFPHAGFYREARDIPGS